MNSGNGIDLAAIYQLLTEVAEKVASHDRRFDQIDRRFEQADRRAVRAETRLDEHTTKLNELIKAENVQGQKLDALAEIVNERGQKLDRVADEVSDLRQTLADYHSAVVAQGILYSELDERVTRVERHPNLQPQRGDR